MKKIVISGTGLYTPAESISNEELVAAFNAYVALFNSQHAQAIAAGEMTALAESSAEFIEKASGIRSRYVINKSGVLDPLRMCPEIPERSNDEWSIQCEIALPAIRQALERAGKKVEDVDAVIVACSNFQRAYPAMAVEIQAAMGIDGWAYDMNVACSSATFGIQAAADAIRAGSARCVLMVNPEITSAHTEWKDRDCHFIFGDVCTAVVIEAAETASSQHAFEILSTRLKTQFSNNIRNNFGFLNRADESGIGARDKTFMQEGRKVFKEVCPMVAEHILAHVGELNVATESLSRLWLHQANLNMNDLIAKRVYGRDFDRSEAPVILDQYANTSSAGSVIAFHLHHDDLPAGAMCVLCSFGAGYSVGSVVLKKL